MANEKNLIPFDSSQSREKAKKNGKKGGKKSGQVRREKATIKKLLGDVLGNPCKKNPQFENLCLQLGIESKESVKKLFIIVSLLNSMKKGGIDDLCTLEKLLGENTEQNNTEETFIEKLARQMIKDDK